MTGHKNLTGRFRSNEARSEIELSGLTRQSNNWRHPVKPQGAEGTICRQMLSFTASHSRGTMPRDKLRHINSRKKWSGQLSTQANNPET
jgi:hypothetical protein